MTDHLEARDVIARTLHAENHADIDWLTLPKDHLRYWRERADTIVTALEKAGHYLVTAAGVEQPQTLEVERSQQNPNKQRSYLHEVPSPNGE